MKKNKIRLTESQLYRVIKESVNKLLKEHHWNDNDFDEDDYDETVNYQYDENGDLEVALCNRKSSLVAQYKLKTKPMQDYLKTEECKKAYNDYRFNQSKKYKAHVGNSVIDLMNIRNQLQEELRAIGSLKVWGIIVNNMVML